MPIKFSKEGFVPVEAYPRAADYRELLESHTSDLKDIIRSATEKNARAAADGNLSSNGRTARRQEIGKEAAEAVQAAGKLRGHKMANDLATASAAIPTNIPSPAAEALRLVRKDKTWTDNDDRQSQENAGIVAYNANLQEVRTMLRTKPQAEVVGMLHSAVENDDLQTVHAISTAPAIAPLVPAAELKTAHQNWIARHNPEPFAKAEAIRDAAQLLDVNAKRAVDLVQEVTGYNHNLHTLPVAV